MRTFTLPAAALLLAACSTPQERAAKMQAEMEHMMVVYGPACARLGYQANSDQWRNCVLQLSAKEEIERATVHPYYGWGPDYWRASRYWGPYW